ncbi:glycosyltransferase family 2 protein [Ruficoccus amylovorans]|uniref:Glycosyltransferase family 2 protein n=1 Tax=Ruficoccus amylovorans TaxID=1804625 RepID=A0A842HGV8_9BACT|nr:glycosyltransferase family 2 protein [Ruficoccus amylovorans]MBC2594856.1 glycosyltransferase family 2 protein [Ruficoccus amylovorans]
MSTARGPLPLTVCLLAHNEAHRIRACLDAVKDMASEIVLVYNDCTDGTETIARDEYGAKIFEHPWQGFREQKNLALDQATQPWVLNLDCDEIVDETLAASLRAFIEADDPAFAGAHFPRKVWFLGRWIKHGDWYPDHCLRLIRLGKGRWGGSPEHTKIELEGRSQLLAGDLLHYSNPTLNSQIEKINYYSDIYLRRQLDDGKKWSLTHALFRPFWRFFRAYFLRRGFLDGFPGLYIASLTSFATLVRHSRLYEYNTTPEVREKFQPRPDC